MLPAFHSSKLARMISTFSCDIAYSEPPAAASASASVSKLRHQTHFPSRHRATYQSAPLEGHVTSRSAAADEQVCDRQLPTVMHCEHLDAPVGETSSQFFHQRRIPSWP